MASPSYKLTYFAVAALGEPIRFLFSYGGIDFEDVRVTNETWPQFKPNTPFEQVPVLEYKGKIVHQSVAIARYVAKQVKLVGKDDWEDLEIDAVVDTVVELRSKVTFYYYADPTVKESLKEPLFKETIPFYLQRLDAIVKSNNGYLAVGRLTWADIFFVSLLDYLNNMVNSNILDGYPNLQALQNKILAIPSIKSWVEKRPPDE